MLNKIPVKQLLKHRKVFIIFLIVATIYTIQLCFSQPAPIVVEVPVIEHNETKETKETETDMTLPVNVIPNIHSLLGANIEHEPSNQVEKCKFPDDEGVRETNYAANVTQSDLPLTEKSVFGDLTEKVRALTSEANDLLQRVMSEKGVDSASGVRTVRKQTPQEEELKIAKNGLDFGSHVYFPGGHWIPKKCAPKWKVAIIIPYRNRSANLHTLLRNLVPFLLNQELEFAIYIAEQSFSEVMNRGMMRNIGYQMAKYSGTKWDCYIFHDVDYVPMNATNYYGCDQFPKHYAVKLEEFKYDNPYIVDFGGVVGLTGYQMDRINGYSNMFWGWGGEDDDVYKRIRSKKFNVTRSERGYYRDLPHMKKTKGETCLERFCLVKYSYSRMATDGLSAVRYQNTTEIGLYTLYTNITVDAMKEFWNYGYKRCSHFRRRSNSNTIAVICVMCYAGVMIVIFTCAFIGLAVKYPDEIPEGMDEELWSERTSKTRKRQKELYKDLPPREAI